MAALRFGVRKSCTLKGFRIHLDNKPRGNWLAASINSIAGGIFTSAPIQCGGSTGLFKKGARIFPNICMYCTMKLYEAHQICHLIVIGAIFLKFETVMRRIPHTCRLVLYLLAIFSCIIRNAYVNK